MNEERTHRVIPVKVRSRLQSVPFRAVTDMFFIETTRGEPAACPTVDGR